jgi:hypothetical protein
LTSAAAVPFLVSRCFHFSLFGEGGFNEEENIDSRYYGLLQGFSEIVAGLSEFEGLRR